MKKLLFSILFGVIIISIHKPAQAQMAAAQPTQWDVTKQTEVTTSQDLVWEMLSNLKSITTYSKGYVKSAEIKGSGITFERTLTFADGTTRIEQIDQVDKQYKFLAYGIKKESLPAGITSITIAVFTKATAENKTNLKWLARIEGTTEAKQAFKTQLESEFERYISGIANLYSNVIPAAKMN